MNIKLAWKSGAGASAYEVWRSTTEDTGTASKIADVTGNAYFDETVAEGSTYFYWIKSVNSAGTSGFSASSGALAAGKTLRAPTGVSATLFDVGTVDVSWTASSGATAYDVYRNTTEDFGTASLIGSTSGTTYADTPAFYDILYVYWVVAKDGSSHFSDPSFAAGGYTAPAAPAVPGGVLIAAGACNGIRFEWTTGARAAYYEVYRGTDSAGMDRALVGTTPEIFYEDTPPSIGVEYFYWAKSVNYTGTSDFSEVVSGFATVAPNLEPPFSLTASTDEPDHIYVEWTAVMGVESWALFRDGALLIELSAATLSYSDYAVTAGVPYLYEMLAVTGTCESDFSAGATGEAMGAPDAPASVTASDDQVNNVEITWPSVTGADSYNVYRAGVLIASGVGFLFYNDNTGDADFAYTYAVSAVNAAGESGMTSDSGTALSPPPVGYSSSGGDEGHIGGFDVDYNYDLYCEFNGGGVIPDRMRVYNNATLVFDSSCTSGSANATVAVVPGVIEVTIETHCDASSPPPSTAWSFTVESV